jgi:translation initiation factor IF-3
VDVNKLVQSSVSIAFVEFAPKQEGRQMTMVLGPTKKKTEVVAEQKAAKAAKEKAAEAAAE